MSANLLPLAFCLFQRTYYTIFISQSTFSFYVRRVALQTGVFVHLVTMDSSLRLIVSTVSILLREETLYN